jgi:hypothetical protein
MTNPVPVTLTTFSGADGLSETATSDLPAAVAMGGFGGAIEKSPAAATPLAFVRSTQFAMIGTSLPTIAKSKLTGR